MPKCKVILNGLATSALGVYPEVSLREAREKRDEARKSLAQGIDPNAERKATKTVESETFEAIAREWFGSPSWVESHADKIIRRLERDIFPWIGHRPIREVLAPELLTVLRRIEGRGAVETAHRAMQNCGQVFRYAVATGWADRDPAAAIFGALCPRSGKRTMPALPNLKLSGHYCGLSRGMPVRLQPNALCSLPRWYLCVLANCAKRNGPSSI